MLPAPARERRVCLGEIKQTDRPPHVLPWFQDFHNEQGCAEKGKQWKCQRYPLEMRVSCCHVKEPSNDKGAEPNYSWFHANLSPGLTVGFWRVSWCPQ